MIEGLRRLGARREVRAALKARRPRPLPPDPRRRSVLLVLPAADDALRAVWALVDQLDLGDRQLIPVFVGERLGYAPDRWAGSIQVLGPEAHDWRRLPTRAARRSVWGRAPDVALNLAGSDLGAALVAGASPAAVRVGVHAPDREAFYDVMVQPGADPPQTTAALGRLLRHLDPPIVPLRPC